MTRAIVDQARIVDWAQLNLAELMALEREPGDIFVGLHNEDNGAGRIFGGQVLGQALAAAGRTLPVERSIHSLQLTFCSGGRPSSAIRYRVESVSDGATTSVRSVRAEQGSRLVCVATVSAQVPGRAFEHDDPPRDWIPDAAACADVRALVAGDSDQLGGHPLGFLARKGSVEARLVDYERYVAAPGERSEAGPLRFWIRSAHPLTSNALIRQCAVAYLTDYLLAHAPPLRVGPYSDVGRMRIASINHAFWFHRPIDDDWLLVDATCPMAASGRGLVTAKVYDRARHVVAVTAQECIYRYTEGER